MSVEPPDRPDADEVARIFLEAMLALNRRSGGAEIAVLNEPGLTIPQLVALHVLRERGSITVGDVAECTRLSPAATSHLVERLVRLGLAHRVEDAEDRRQKQVSISPTGAALLERLLQARMGSLTRVMGLLQPETRRLLAGAMTALASDIATQGDGGKTP